MRPFFLPRRYLDPLPGVRRPRCFGPLGAAPGGHVHAGPLSPTEPSINFWGPGPIVLLPALSSGPGSDMA